MKGRNVGFKIKVRKNGGTHTHTHTRAAAKLARVASVERVDKGAFR